MFDAIPSREKLSQAGETDPEMDKFLPLLKDYLRSEQYIVCWLIYSLCSPRYFAEFRH